MVERFRQFFQAPQFEDKEQTRIARLLNLILRVTLAVALVGQIALVILDVFTGSVSALGTSLTITLGLVLALMFMQWLVRQGRLNLASGILATALFLSGTASVALFGGLQDTGITFFLLVIVLVGLLLGRRAVLTFTLLSLVVTLIVYLAEVRGILTFEADAGADFASWIIFTIVAVLVGLLQTTAINSINTAYNQARENEQSLSRSNQQLEAMRSSLEARVAERTGLHERRARQLEAAAEVGQAATAIFDLEELMAQTPRLVSGRFGFYHVGIFLVDGAREYAVLRASNSEGGRRMLARGHKLRVGQEGMVGHVTATGEARIALNVGQDAVFFNNPDLPETQSEMALPLVAGGRVFGALDVQSKETNAFSQDDIASLRVLADQVALAISNAQLFQQLQNSLEAERRAFGEVTRDAWRELLETRRSWGYRYANSAVLPASGNWPEELQAAMLSDGGSQEVNKSGLALPLRVGNVVIGGLSLRKASPDDVWTEEEVGLVETLTDRLGQALESARLYQETQLQAAQEQISGEISNQIRQTLDLDSVLRTAARQLGETFGAREVIIRMNPDEGQGS